MKVEHKGYVLQREDTGDYYGGILDSRFEVYCWEETIEDEVFVFEEQPDGLEVAKIVATEMSAEDIPVKILKYHKVIEVEEV